MASIAAAGRGCGASAAAEALRATRLMIIAQARRASRIVADVIFNSRSELKQVAR
jgi:hypothetical protein